MKSLEGISQYRNYTSGICKAKVSRDKIKWDEVPVVEMSAEGLTFSTSGNYAAGEQVYLNVSIISGFSEFNMSFEGKVVSNGRSTNLYNCRVKFGNVDRNTGIQLDELLGGIPGGGSVHAQDAGKSSLISDGEYAFNLRPKQRKPK